MQHLVIHGDRGHAHLDLRRLPSMLLAARDTAGVAITPAASV
jgi:hypothetical protein